MPKDSSHSNSVVGAMTLPTDLEIFALHLSTSHARKRCAECWCLPPLKMLVINGVKTHNIFADNVNWWFGGIEPKILVKFRIFIGKTKCRNIVGQSVKPNIHHVFRHLELLRPKKRGARNRQIFESTFYKRNHFIKTRLRANEIWRCFVKS